VQGELDVSDYYLATREDVLPLVPKVGSYLEVGCASGNFGAQLKRQFPDAVVWGVEPVSGPAEVASGRLDRVVNGLFPACLPEIDRIFDCIICNDVLEHMADPWTALDALVGLLAPGGVLVTSIPNVRNPQTIFRLVVRGRWDYEPSGVLDKTHLRFFTKSTARELLEGAGLQVREVVGSHPLGVNRWAWLRLDRWPIVKNLLFRQYIMVASRRTA